MAIDIYGYGTNSLPSKIEGPNLIYPNGGEIFLEKDIKIRWDEPFVSSDLLWTEIIFTEEYKRNAIQEWRGVAVVQSGKLEYTWSPPPSIKSSKCRIGIKAVNYRGDVSDLSISANDFTIGAAGLSKPSVIEPISGSSYYSHMPIILDKSSVLGRYSQRAYYNIYYSSKSQNINWTLLKSYISINSGPIYWDLRHIKKASDYILRIELCDNDNISEPVFIDNISISGLNYFIIDTEAPTGTLKILNNQEYTKNKGITVKLSAYDKTTGVDEFRIEQLELSSNPITSIKGPFEKITNIATWQIKGNDGLKLIQARFKDAAGNILKDVNTSFFRTYKSIENLPVNAFLIDGENYWMAFGGDVPSLYLNRQCVGTLDGEATSMCIYDDAFYIAIKTAINTGIVYKYSAGVLNEIVNLSRITNLAVGKADCVVNSMAVFDEKLFLGLQNGLLYYYDGSYTYPFNGDEVNPKSICKLGSNSSNLFIFLNNDETFKIMYKHIDDTYRIFEVTI